MIEFNCNENVMKISYKKQRFSENTLQIGVWLLKCEGIVYFITNSIIIPIKGAEK